MFAWLDQYSSALSTIASLGLLVVWIFYAQLALNGILKQRRPRILINQVKGRDLNAEVIIANMSEQKIFIQLLLARVSADGEEYTRAITDVYIYDDDDSSRIAERDTSQGPLNPGASLQLGSFHQVAERVARGSGETCPWHFMELRVVFFYGSATSVVAALRRFDFVEDEDGKRRVNPVTLDTRHMYRIWHHRRIRRWLREYL